jgi:hypothetical protein
MVWYGMVWCGMVWCGMVWCGVVYDIDICYITVLTCFDMGTNTNQVPKTTSQKRNLNPLYTAENGM